MIHDGAFHGCLLVAETSCEAREMGRALLVDALGRVGASFFWFLQSVSGSERLSYGVLAREGNGQV